MQFRIPLTVAILLSLAACGSQEKPHTTVDASPSTQAYEVSMHKMHQDMMIDYTGNADVDFVRGMVPHHQGAIDMAKTELKYGTDPKLRKLARKIIASQKKEVAYMQQWLNTHSQN